MDITIIGTGKVASNLALSLKQAGCSLQGIWGRRKEPAMALAESVGIPLYNNLIDIPKNTLALICVSDSAIFELLQTLPKSIAIAYTSGSIPLDTLPERENLGVFYPLQTFSKGRVLDLKNVPFLIEANNKNFETELISLAKNLSQRVQVVNSVDRFQLHIAAVMVNNFTNHLYYMANQHLTSKSLEFSLLLPLIQETALKLEELTPKEAQTGPASRGDLKIIERHIKAIDDSETKELYQLFSNYIQNQYTDNGED